MYSPPSPRTTAAILAKFSEPKYARGLIMMWVPASSKNSMFSSSLGNALLMSTMLRIPAAAGAGADGVGAGAGAPRSAFSCFEMSVRSSEMSFRIVRSWSMRCANSSTEVFFSLMWIAGFALLFGMLLPFLFCP